jgi:hypothetical protein
MHLAESRYAKPMPVQLLAHAKTIRARQSPRSSELLTTKPLDLNPRPKCYKVKQ